MKFELSRYVTTIRYLAAVPLMVFGLLSILATGGGGGSSSPQIDLSLTKVVDDVTPAVGANVVFTLTVDNAAGVSGATGVVVTDALPNGYAYVSDDGGATTAVAGNTVTWSVGTLAAGTNVVLNITARVLGAGVYQNNAEVTAATETDIDSTPGDGTGDDFASAMVTPAPSLYFHATDGVTGRELWKSDGTAAGTVRVKDINIGASSSILDTNFPDFTVFNGALYFRANDGVNGEELWKSDGTKPNTVRVKDINSGAGSSNTNLDDRLTVFNGALYFAAFDGADVELWKTDGTEAGTVRVKDINTVTGSSSPVELTVFNGELYFSADDGVNGVELWKTDGTEAGTVRVKDINSGAGWSNPTDFRVFNGKLYFSADDGMNGVELWKTDGTDAGTVLVKDIRNGGNDSTPRGLTVFNGELYFSANDGSGVELWKSGGTDLTTVRVKDIRNGGGSSNPTELTVFNGELYFSANDGSGVELWKSGGTDLNTVRVKDINSGGGSSNPGGFTVFSGRLYFSANDGSGVELWKSDGTDAGTVLVKDINSVTGSSDPAELTVFSGELYFSADDGMNGRELWKTDGMSNPVRLDINGTGDSNPTELTPM